MDCLVYSCKILDSQLRQYLHLVWRGWDDPPQLGISLQNDYPTAGCWPVWVACGKFVCSVQIDVIEPDVRDVADGGKRHINSDQCLSFMIFTKSYLYTLHLFGYQCVYMNSVCLCVCLCIYSAPFYSLYVPLYEPNTILCLYTSAHWLGIHVRPTSFPDIETFLL